MLVKKSIVNKPLHYPACLMLHPVAIKLCLSEIEKNYGNILFAAFKRSILDLKSICYNQ